MRSGRRLSLSPGEFRSDERAQQALVLERLVDELERARDRGDEWYVWIRDVWGPRRRGASDGVKPRALGQRELARGHDEAVDQSAVSIKEDLADETHRELVGLVDVVVGHVSGTCECPGNQCREPAVESGDTVREFSELHQRDPSASIGQVR